MPSVRLTVDKMVGMSATERTDRIVSAATLSLAWFPAMIGFGAASLVVGTEDQILNAFLITFTAISVLASIFFLPLAVRVAQRVCDGPTPRPRLGADVKSAVAWLLLLSAATGVAISSFLWANEHEWFLGFLAGSLFHRTVRERAEVLTALRESVGGAIPTS